MEKHKTMQVREKIEIVREIDKRAEFEGLDRSNWLRQVIRQHLRDTGEN